MYIKYFKTLFTENNQCVRVAMCVCFQVNKSKSKWNLINYDEKMVPKLYYKGIQIMTVGKPILILQWKSFV